MRNKLKVHQVHQRKNHRSLVSGIPNPNKTLNDLVEDMESDKLQSLKDNYDIDSILKDIDKEQKDLIYTLYKESSIIEFLGKCISLIPKSLFQEYMEEFHKYNKNLYKCISKMTLSSIKLGFDINVGMTDQKICDKILSKLPLESSDISDILPVVQLVKIDNYSNINTTIKFSNINNGNIMINNIPLMLLARSDKIYLDIDNLNFEIQPDSVIEYLVMDKHKLVVMHTEQSLIELEDRVDKIILTNHLSNTQKSRPTLKETEKQYEWFSIITKALITKIALIYQLIQLKFILYNNLNPNTTPVISNSDLKDFTESLASNKKFIEDLGDAIVSSKFIELFFTNTLLTNKSDILKLNKQISSSLDNLSKQLIEIKGKGFELLNNQNFIENTFIKNKASLLTQLNDILILINQEIIQVTELLKGGN